MVDIAVGSLCAACGRYSAGLYTCKACGSRVCLACVDAASGFCKLCGGIRRTGGSGRTPEHFK